MAEGEESWGVWSRLEWGRYWSGYCSLRSLSDGRGTVGQALWSSGGGKVGHEEDPGNGTGVSSVGGGLRVAATCVTVEDGGEVLVLDRKRGIYYGLNGTATYIWQGIGKGWSAQVLRENYAGHFKLSSALAAREVEELLERLVMAELVIK